MVQSDSKESFNSMFWILEEISNPLNSISSILIPKAKCIRGIIEKRHQVRQKRKLFHRPRGPYNSKYRSKIVHTIKCTMQLKCCLENRFRGLAMGHKAGALCPLTIDRLNKKKINCKPYVLTHVYKTILKTIKWVEMILNIT